MSTSASMPNESEQSARSTDHLLYDPITGTRRSKRVLVVDDEPDIMEFMLSALGVEGYETRVCANVEDAQAMLADWTPDVLVTDLMMLPQDGTSLIAWTRARFGKSIRTILYSARLEPESTTVVAAVTKPDAYLAKPFGIDELYRAIEGD